MYQIDASTPDFPEQGILGLAYSPNSTWNYLYSIKDSLKEKVVSFSVGEVSSVQFGGTNSSLYNGPVSTINRKQDISNAWAFDIDDVTYGGTIPLSSTTPAIIDTSQTFLLMPSADYNAFKSQVTKLDGFNCDLLDYCVSVTHDCVYYQNQLKNLTFKTQTSTFEFGPQQYMQDDFQGAQCAILISELNTTSSTINGYVFGLTFLRSYYLMLNFTDDAQQVIKLAPSVYAPKISQTSNDP